MASQNSAQQGATALPGEFSHASGAATPSFAEKSDGDKEDILTENVEAASFREFNDEDSSNSSSSSGGGGSGGGHHRIRQALAAIADHEKNQTMSEVRDGLCFRRDVEINGIERAEVGELAGLSHPETTEDANLKRGLSGESRIASRATRGVADASGEESGGASGASGAGEEADLNLVKWKGPEDPENPKNWTITKKWAAVFIVSLFTLISPVSSSMVAPALVDIGRDLDITSSVEQLLTLSIFILAYAVGPLFLGPLSELYGRVIVLQLSNLVYLFFNLGCGLAKTRGQMIAFRFLSGFGGSAPLAIGGGVLADLFTAEQRGRALSMYSLAPLLGPAIGPIAGAFIAQNTTWRWVFYSTTIADGVIQVAGLFFLRETYAPVLLTWKRNRLRKETGNHALYTVFDDARAGGVVKTLRIAFSRPFVMLGTQLIVQVLALYMMYLYGLLYLVLATFPVLWTTIYNEGQGISGLNYISLGVGLALGAQVLAPLQDRIYAYLKRRYKVSVGRPEFRVPIMVPGAILVPAGLLIFGWTAEYHTHWIGPNIGAAVLASGVIVGFQCIQGYLVDTYTRYAASAVGATTILRSIAGFGFPLFAPDLYNNLGYGKGNTVLAAVGIVIGWPAPFLLWKYGQYLRTKKTSFQG
ncbi:MAG: hypothetical protein STHCBS139747_005208 [Sporothrix thermara]